jgi:hypothetical protein
MTLSAEERIDALAMRGVMLYVDSDGELRARCEPCFANILDVAIPMIRQHRSEIVAYLVALSAKPRRSRGET